MKEHDGNNMSVPCFEVGRFEVITLSILLSVAVILAGGGYDDLQHAIEISVADNTIEELSRFLNKALTAGMLYWQSVMFVSVFHCGASPAILNYDAPSHHVLVGYRNCYLRYFQLSYSIWHQPSVPLVFAVKMSSFPSPCKTTTALLSEESETWAPDTASFAIEEDDLEIQHDISGSIIGPSEASAPDIDIYLSTQRLPTSPKPYLCLAARYNEYLIGTVGISDVLKTLALSLLPQRHCPKKGHPFSTHVRVLRALLWAHNRSYKPTD